MKIRLHLSFYIMNINIRKQVYDEFMISNLEKIDFIKCQVQLINDMNIKLSLTVKICIKKQAKVGTHQWSLSAKPEACKDPFIDEEKVSINQNE